MKRYRLSCLFLYRILRHFADKHKKKSKKKSLGELQREIKCEIEPSDEITKLDCKDWPLLFKVKIY